MKHFTNFRTVKERVSKKNMMDRRVTELPFYHFRKLEETSILDNEAQIQATIKMSLDDQWQLKELAKHRTGFGLSHYESALGPITNGGESEFRRTSSIRDAVNRGGGRIAFMLETFSSRKKSFR